MTVRLVETVRIATRFAHDFPREQLCLPGCRNFEHEDMAMMIDCNIV